jgi:uncharacterized membrane protein
VLLLPEYPNEPWTDKPHNSILEIAFSSGVLGLALYLFFIGFILIALIRKAQNSEASDKTTASLLFGLFVAYLLQLFFAFDTVLSLQSFFTMTALVSIFCFGEVEYFGKRNLDQYIKVIVKILLTMFSIGMIYFFSFKVWQESRMLRGMNEMSVEARALVFEKTMNTSPVGASGTESQYIDLVVSKYKEKWSSYNTEIRVKVQKELKFFFVYSVKQSDKYPFDLRWAVVSSGIGNMLFEMSGVKDLALLEVSKKYGMRAISNSPQNPMGYQAVAESLILEGKPAMAKKFMQMVVGMNSK